MSSICSTIGSRSVRGTLARTHTLTICYCTMDAESCAKLDKSSTYHDKGFQKLFPSFEFGLEKNSKFQFRVYILECKGPRGEKVWYCGIVHWSGLLERLRKHFGRQGSHYTKVYPAQKLVFLWTCPTVAGEPLAYYEMLRHMSPDSAWKLGGFVQTSSHPSRLDCLMVEQARRGLCELCFNCGQKRFQGEHLRLGKCPFTLRGVEYACPVEHCSGKILVTSRGHAEKVPEPPKPAAAPPVAPAKRPAPASVPPPRKAARTVVACESHGARVRICHELYTSLSWFLKSTNPSKKQCEHAKANCSEQAVELAGGHVRALAGTAYARAAPGQPKPLCLVRGGAERARLGEGPVNTEIQGLTLERASGGLSKRLSQVLFRVDALEQAFSSF